MDPNDAFQYSFTLLGPADLDVQSWGYGGGVNAGGILGAGFIGTGSYNDPDNQADRSPAFAVDVSVTGASPSVPEPSTCVLLLIPMLLLLARIGRAPFGL